jgi:hypothetical protein
MDEFEANDGFAIWPASREIGRPVDPIVERACEMETLVDQGLYRRPVFVHVGEITCSGDAFGIFDHFVSIGSPAPAGHFRCNWSRVLREQLPNKTKQKKEENPVPTGF